MDSILAGMKTIQFFAVVLGFACSDSAPLVAQENKVSGLLEFRAAEQLAQPKRFNPVLTYNARLIFKPDNSDKPWIDVTFHRPDGAAQYAFSAVIFETSYEYVTAPLDERRIPDGGAEWPNVWLGYDRFMFDYRNDENAPLKVTVLIQDFVSWLPKKYDGLEVVRAQRPQAELPQLYEEEIVLQPGEGTAAIDLKKPLWTNNRAKGLSLDNIKAFGLCIKSPARKVVIGVNRFRLESADRSAGVWRSPKRVHCPKCGQGFSDPYAPFCPFCSGEMSKHEQTPHELPSFGKEFILVKAIDGGGGGSSDGGGGDTCDVAAGPIGSKAIRHYDVYYNRPKGTPPLPERKRVQWQYRYQLKFALGDEFARKPKIKRATLWVAASLNLKDHPEIVFCQKPWLPGVVIFSINEAYDDWQGTALTFATTPAYEKLIYVGGQHTGPATQNPKLRIEGHPAANCLPMEITGHVQDMIDSGRKTFSIALKAYTPAGAAKDPHGMGHTMNFFGIGHEKCPVIAVELDQ